MANPDVKALSDGSFIVTWQDSSSGSGAPSGTAIRAQVFANASGSDTPV